MTLAKENTSATTHTQTHTQTRAAQQLPHSRVRGEKAGPLPLAAAARSTHRSSPPLSSNAVQPSIRTRPGVITCPPTAAPPETSTALKDPRSAISLSKNRKNGEGSQDSADRGLFYREAALALEERPVYALGFVNPVVHNLTPTAHIAKRPSGDTRIIRWQVGLRDDSAFLHAAKRPRDVRDLSWSTARSEGR